MTNSSLNAQDSVFAHREMLHGCVKDGTLSEQVLSALLPSGNAIEYERQLWDYKLVLPTLNISQKPSEAALEEFNGAICEIIKDIVAFYNSYGGYLVIGVANLPRKIKGFSGNFDCDDINKRVLAATGQQIECFYRKFSVANLEKLDVEVGLLLIPQRLDGRVPAQFIKDASKKISGKQAFAKGDIYFRFADSCIQARSSEDYAFLFTPNRRRFSAGLSLQTSPVLFSSMGDRDPGFIQFVGREEYLALLWRWFLDKFISVKLLAGIGGVGKTALAREFAEQVGRAAPFGFERIIWLSAKRQYYTAINGKYIPSGKVDFSGVEELLQEIALQLGASESEVSVEIGREALMQTVIDSLRIIPALVVIDDVDSLGPEICCGQVISDTTIGSCAAIFRS